MLRDREKNKQDQKLLYLSNYVIGERKVEGEPEDDDERPFTLYYRITSISKIELIARYVVKGFGEHSYCYCRDLTLFVFS